MKLALKNSLRRAVYQIIDPSREKFLDTRKPISFSPYSIDLYRGLLQSISQNSAIEVPPFSSQASTKKARVFLRHDIDTEQCIKNVEWMIGSDADFGYSAGIFFLVDDEEYSLADYRSVVETCVERGFEVGLHTVCYTEDDYLERFRLETEKFADEAGFRPKVFTIHGLGDFRLDVRLRFIRDIRDTLQEYSYEFSDCHKSLRKYHYVIEDCHMDAQSGKRFVYNDFEKLPDFFRPARDYLILTHPCYWIE